MALFNGLGHVALRVKDIDASLAFYTEKLGCAEMMRLLFEDGSLFLVYLRVTDEQFLELFPDAVGDRAPGRETVGLNHICLTVEKIETTLAALAEAGVELTRPLKTGADGNRQAWIDDPDGNRIEIMEMRPQSLQYEALKALAAGGAPIVRKTENVRPLTFA